ncbi:hypothetical protein [Streptomyces sp. NBC_01264]|uniref:hypothetical protein n=1 Tax=Streptomyces sp. NBC_01264 TaxID=2903804 RepID=UPI002256F437|nr:hypothetical protein [Streptomyces sp. NBC_01264]MCX4780581.1 hypothetical protein [Streptomyces sp. NBC_01264]
MADERDRWLDEAAADRMLRGEPAAPGADHPARVRAERLRAALDALAEPPPAAPGGLPGELRGEAAAVAAFRARGSVLRAQAQTRAPDSALFGSADTVVELGAPAGPVAGASRRGRPVRFALAAAVASVAVGGLAAAAGTGLLDRGARNTAGELPAVSVTAGSSPAVLADGGYATPLAPSRTTSPRGEPRGGIPSPGNTPGAEGRTPTGPGGATGVTGDTGTQPSAEGSAGDKGGRGDRSRQGGADGAATGLAGGSDRDREGRTGAVELCRDFRAGRLDEAGREKLVRLAKGLLRVPRYCQAVLGLATGGGSGGDAPGKPSGSGPGRGPSSGPDSPSRSLGLVPAGTAAPERPDAGSRR